MHSCRRRAQCAVRQLSDEGLPRVSSWRVLPSRCVKGARQGVCLAIVVDELCSDDLDQDIRADIGGAGCLTSDRGPSTRVFQGSLVGGLPDLPARTCLPSFSGKRVATGP